MILSACLRFHSHFHNNNSHCCLDRKLYYCWEHCQFLMLLFDICGLSEKSRRLNARGNPCGNHSWDAIAKKCSWYNWKSNDVVPICLL